VAVLFRDSILNSVYKYQNYLFESIRVHSKDNGLLLFERIDLCTVVTNAYNVSSAPEKL